MDMIVPRFLIGQFESTIAFGDKRFIARHGGGTGVNDKWLFQIDKSQMHVASEIYRYQLDADHKFFIQILHMGVWRFIRIERINTILVGTRRLYSMAGFIR